MKHAQGTCRGRAGRDRSEFPDVGGGSCHLLPLTVQKPNLDRTVEFQHQLPQLKWAGCALEEGGSVAS